MSRKRVAEVVFDAAPSSVEPESAPDVILADAPSVIEFDAERLRRGGLGALREMNFSATKFFNETRRKRQGLRVTLERT